VRERDGTSERRGIKRIKKKGNKEDKGRREVEGD
jgi:hypothetical protein